MLHPYPVFLLVIICLTVLSGLSFAIGTAMCARDNRFGTPWLELMFSNYKFYSPGIQHGYVVNQVLVGGKGKTPEEAVEGQ